MVVPSGHAFVHLTVAGLSNGISRMVCVQTCTVKQLQEGLEQFLLDKYNVVAPPSSQHWSVPEDASVLDLITGVNNRSVGLDPPVLTSLKKALVFKACERQKDVARRILSTFGEDDKSVEQWCAEIDEIHGKVAAELTEFLPTDLAQITAQYLPLNGTAAVAKFASTLNIRETFTSCSTGISTHNKVLTQFTSTVGSSPEVWEWRVDYGEIDGYQYISSELVRVGTGTDLSEPVLQVKFDEDDDSKKIDVWRSSSTQLADPYLPLDPAGTYQCFECVLSKNYSRASCHGFDPSWVDDVEVLGSSSKKGGTNWVKRLRSSFKQQRLLFVPRNIRADTRGRTLTVHKERLFAEPVVNTDPAKHFDRF